MLLKGKGQIKIVSLTPWVLAPMMMPLNNWVIHFLNICSQSLRACRDSGLRAMTCRCALEERAHKLINSLSIKSFFLLIKLRHKEFVLFYNFSQIYLLCHLSDWFRLSVVMVSSLSYSKLFNTFVLQQIQGFIISTVPSVLTNPLLLPGSFCCVICCYCDHWVTPLVKLKGKSMFLMIITTYPNIQYIQQRFALSQNSIIPNSPSRYVDRGFVPHFATIWSVLWQSEAWEVSTERWPLGVCAQQHLGRRIQKGQFNIWRLTTCCLSVKVWG